MHLSNKIILLGMPGSGKSTLGKQLAEVLDLPFYDLDELIESNQGVSIKEMFSTKGEETFRQIESTTLQDFLNKEDKYVLAVGGGAPCFFQNITLMNDSAKTIYLDIPLNELVKRIQESQLDKRPLFQNNSIAEKIKGLSGDRHSIFKQAQYHIKGSDIDVEEIVKVLKEKPNSE